MKVVGLAWVLGCVVGTLGCDGEQRMLARFTSDVVQHQICRRTPSSVDENCVADAVTERLRVDLIELEEDRLWLSGIEREGETDRRVLGTRDAEGGFLFETKTVDENLQSGCILTTQLLLSLAIPADIEPERVGTDACVPLVGREIRTVSTSARCDTISVPPQAQERIARRRWEPAAGCVP